MNKIRNNIKIKFLIALMFVFMIGFLGNVSYASEITGTLSTGTDQAQNTNASNMMNNPEILSGQVTLPQNNQLNVTRSSMLNNLGSNLFGINNNDSTTMLEGIIVGILLTFFIGLLFFMIVKFMRRNRMVL